MVIVGLYLVITKFSVTVPTQFDLSVSATPTRARIFQDGQDTGRSTPAILNNLKPDREYLLELRAPGYKTQEKRFKLTTQELSERTDANPSVRLFLKRAKGNLYVTSTPSGATVYAGDRELGRTPVRKRGLKKSAAGLRLTLRRVGCKTERLILEWTNDPEERVHADLKCK